MGKENTGSITSNTIWRLAEKFGAKIVTFVVSIILARKLGPEIYGTVALISVFTAIFDTFIDSGLGNALIQKKNADDLDFSSVFYFNIAVCIILYLIMFFGAPLIADFYKIPELTPLVRVQSLTLIISGVKNIQYAYISKNMMFKKFFWATLFGTIVSAIVGILMAYRGYGVWALISQMLTNYTIDTIMLWLLVDWRPKWVFSFNRLKVLLSYGWKLLVAKLIYTTYTKICDLLIGKIYTTADLAFYHKGSSFPNLIVPNVTQSIDGVMFPAMANKQDNVKEIKDLVKKSIQASSFIIMPMMAGLIACGKPMIELLLTGKWLPSVPFLVIFCIIYSFWPLQIANMNAIRAIGRSDIFLKLEIIERVFSIIVLLSMMRISVLSLALAYMIGELFTAYIIMVPNKKLINYGPLEQIKDLLPLIIISTIMGAIVYLIQLLNLNNLITLIIQIPSGVIIYLLLSKIFKLYGLDFIINKIRKLIKRGA